MLQDAILTALVPFLRCSSMYNDRNSGALVFALMND